MTLVFLGNVEYDKIEKKLKEIPKPPFPLGLVGKFSRHLLLGKVIAWEVDCFRRQNALLDYQMELADFFQIKERYPFLPHVTVARGKFNQNEWEQFFTPLPVTFNHIHLYESLGNSNYKKIFTLPLTPPFEELDHTADVGYTVNGLSLNELYLHAQIALSFQWPPMLNFIEVERSLHSLNEVIMALNERVTVADSEIGCDLKAVSFHGLIQENSGILSWEMLVDV